MTARLLYFSIFVILISSCKKTPVVLPPAAPAVVTVLLKHPYMAADKVDSAVATWTVGNIKQTFTLHLHNDKLSAPFDTLTAGSGKLEVTVYSKIKFNHFYSSRWVQAKEFTNNGKTNLVMEGPAAFTDATWSPRVVLKDGVGNLAVVAMRPDDPYFYVRNVKDDVMELVVARNYWRTKGGVSQVAGREWHCKTNCRNENKDVVNTEFFKFLPTQIGTRTWNHIEIVILYIDQPWGGGYVLDFNFDVTGA